MAFIKCACLQTFLVWDACVCRSPRTSNHLVLENSCFRQWLESQSLYLPTVDGVGFSEPWASWKEFCFSKAAALSGSLRGFNSGWRLSVRFEKCCEWRRIIPDIRRLQLNLAMRGSRGEVLEIEEERSRFQWCVCAEKTF